MCAESLPPREDREPQHVWKVQTGRSLTLKKEEDTHNFRLLYLYIHKYTAVAGTASPYESFVQSEMALWKVLLTWCALLLLICLQAASGIYYIDMFSYNSLL